MHELGIAKSLWAVIRENAEKHKLKKVSKIVINLGKYSGIEKEFLTHSLKDHTLPGTIAEKAKLEFTEGEASFKCGACGKTTPGKDFPEACAFCGSKQLEMVAGQQVYVEYIEG